MQLAIMIRGVTGRNCGEDVNVLSDNNERALTSSTRICATWSSSLQSAHNLIDCYLLVSWGVSETVPS